jgi:hyperpolarization activated cyclic nucleotide-gated potassium channel 1
MDAEVGTQYLHSIYWAFATLTTVGYGDITAYTELEMIFAILWMLFGAGFYSYTIGSLSSFLASIDYRETILREKLNAANSFATETGITAEVKKKVVNLVKQNAAKRGLISDKYTLFDELPKALMYEVALSMHNGIVSELSFFTKRDISFVVFVIPKLLPVCFLDSEYIYHSGELASDAFLISKGRVNLVNENEICYKSFLRGSFIGEVELVLKTSRLDSVQACRETECLKMSKQSFFSVLSEFPTIGRELTAVAKERAQRNQKARLELKEIIRLRKAEGGLSALAGKVNFIELAEEQYPAEVTSEER